MANNLVATNEGSQLRTELAAETGQLSLYNAYTNALREKETTRTTLIAARTQMPSAIIKIFRDKFAAACDKVNAAKDAYARAVG